ncbi:alpha/beta hydrolase [Paenibacillus apiarius]|uniref:alpha/beta hydrolase n=1 Tax=Paenibacillus apiarius TaxID=46240 RepID=UPI003B3BC272
MANQDNIQTASAVNEPAASMVTIPRTEQWDMRSRGGNRDYRIFVAKPSEEPPSAGYPVIYVLDANSVFGTMVETVRVQSRASEKTGVQPAIVVGIGYQTEAPFDPSRFHDFTLPTRVEELPFSPKDGVVANMGGADAFLEFIEAELKPEIESKYVIDTSRQTIFGHSLGGLFALQVFFTKPHTFQTYVAGSPSIHWNKSFLLEAERQFVSRVKQDNNNINVNIMIAAGEDEKLHWSCMNENARELAERLSALASHGVRTEFKEFEGEGHISVLPALISRAVRFASSSE